MSKIPFKVSARTARLIGRENIASSKGAIIELVKNAYDADSSVCILYFDNRYSELLEEFSLDDYSLFIEQGVSKKLFLKIYKLIDNCYQLRDGTDQNEKQLLKRQVQKLNSLYIIDCVKE